MAVPLRSLQKKAMTLLGADTASFAHAERQVRLAAAPFTPGDAALIAGFVEPTTGGLGSIEVGNASPSVNVDAASGQIIMTMTAPIGGWRWVGSDTVGLPVTIYGWFLCDDDNNNRYCCELLPAPLIINAVGQELGIPEASIRLPFGVMT